MHHTELHNHQPKKRRTGLGRRLLAVSATTAALVLGPQAALASAAPADAVTQAAVTIDTGGVNELLLKNALPLAVAFIGILVVLSGRKKDAAGGLTMTGITLLGLAVVGMAAMASPIGDALVGLVVNEG